MNHFKGSLLQRILIPILVVMLIEGVLLCVVVFNSGTMEGLKGNAYDVFNEKVSGRSGTLENDMVGRWSSIESAAETVGDSIRSFMEDEGITTDDLTPDSSYTSALLEKLSEELIFRMRRNAVTGIFVILDGDGSDKKAGLYFRDSDPLTEAADNSDLQAVRAPASITKKLNIALNTNWLPYFQLTKGAEGTGYYYEPYLTAIERPELSGSELGYWCPSFSMRGDTGGRESMILTYSLPVYSNGIPCGVMGIELNMEYLVKQIPSRELSEENYGSYILACKKSGDEDSEAEEYTVVARSGALINQLEGQSDVLRISKESYRKNFYTLLTPNSRQGIVHSCIHDLNLYERNAPFSGDRWVLIGIEEDYHLLSFFYEFERAILFILALTILIGVAAAIIVARAVTKPIETLTYKLKMADPGSPIRLGELKIDEIDKLSGTIENLSREVSDNAHKLEAILDMTGVSVGACEYSDGAEEKIYCSGDFCRLLDIPEEEMAGNYLPASVMKKHIGELKSRQVERDRDAGLYILKFGEEEQERWVRLKVISEKGRILAVATDMTQEMQEKLKIEHDRDFDLLTGLYNRRAFYRLIEDVFMNKKHMAIGAMIMIDLDNLKYVNDTYGHDYGDEYIRTAARVLQGLDSRNSVVARLSGDEFLAFFYGNGSQDTIRRRMDQIYDRFKNTKIHLPDGTSIPVRASAGMAWYPKDGESYDELIRYADFAMYMVKKTNKGAVVEFNLESYSKESYLLQCKEELNTILEKGLVDYAFQPIVDARSGQVYAYEALMRPNTENIKSPDALLSLARSQSKLQQIEKLTFFKGMEIFSKKEISKTDCRIFLNSVSNQVMTDKEIREFQMEYSAYLSRLVIEFTEEEKPDIELTQVKMRYFGDAKGMTALDDFGEGYNGESILLSMNPDFVKFDRALIKNIHEDNKKQDLVAGLITYCRENGAKTIAEGVECRQEMDMLIGMGIDYLQGYYICRPTHFPGDISEEIRQEICDASKTEVDFS